MWKCKSLQRWADKQTETEPAHVYGKASHVAIESDMVLVGGNTAIDRLGVGRRNLELGCQSKSAKVGVCVCM